jgi:competence protein ComGC
MKKKKIVIATMLVVVITLLLSSVIVPLMTAGMTHSVGPEVIATVGAINTACRFYQKDHSEPPADINTLLSGNYFNESDLDGIYFQFGDYIFNSFGDMGNERTGVLQAIALNPETKLFCEVKWDAERKRYDASTKGKPPLNRKVFIKQIEIFLSIAVIVSLLVFPRYIRKS